MKTRRELAPVHHEMRVRTREYLEGLADDYGVDFELVEMLYDLLGPNELHDGLVNALEDYVLDWC